MQMLNETFDRIPPRCIPASTWSALSSLGVGTDLAPPAVLIGDQHSGKSSVLEALPVVGLTRRRRDWEQKHNSLPEMHHPFA
uniref:Dynamin-type G domain-containing protein n=1 Tax=Oryzias latipes TaxID=8090 RepID=A0A3P9K5B1_ORYLA